MVRWAVPVGYMQRQNENSQNIAIVFVKHFSLRCLASAGSEEIH